ncbi:MAG: hypothetical protein V3S46_03960 [Nitrospinota bacterium]
MQIALPRFGNGVESVFKASSTKTVNVAGRLDMASKNMKAIGDGVKRKISAQRIEMQSRISIKA